MNISKKTKIIVGVIIALLVVGGGAFYGGMKAQAAQSAKARTAGFAGRTGAAGGTRFVSGSNFISGTVTAKDSQSITISMQGGSQMIILYSPTTEVGNFVAGSAADLTVGASVQVNGTKNSDGSVTAQSIQLRPAGQAGLGGATPPTTANQ